MLPRSESMVRLTTSMPTPRPEIDVTSRAVEKPGRKISWKSCASVSFSSGAIRPASSALARMRTGSRPLPSSRDRDRDLGAGMDRGRPDACRLPACRRRADRPRTLEAVVDGVADDMDERVGELLDHGLVELGLLAGGLELDRLAELAAEIVHQAAEASEQAADRHHADAHRGVAQAEASRASSSATQLQAWVAAGAGDLIEARLRDHQLADLGPSARSAARLERAATTCCRLRVFLVGRAAFLSACASAFGRLDLGRRACGAAVRASRCARLARCRLGGFLLSALCPEAP